MLLSAACPAVTGNGWPEDPEDRTAAVNGGELHWLAAPPRAAVHHHDNRLTIRVQSLEDGWIAMRQCHENLDPVPRSQVVFRAQRARGLKVDSFHGIARAWVQGASVQMDEVERGAWLCISGEMRTLTGNGDGTFSLHSGPFMRRFLDGYYPMHVTLEVDYTGTGLRFLALTPAPQPGLSLSEGNHTVKVDAWFEGRLHTELRFSRDAQPLEDSELRKFSQNVP